LIVSNDTIMKPPYDITNAILRLVSSISEKIGELNATFLDKPSPQLRKQNKIKTIQSSLQIEGNTLSELQVTALIENKPVAGPQKDILEVLNAIRVYDNIGSFKLYSERSFLSAHKQLMEGLIPGAGKYRSGGVGIVKGSKVTHVAPPARNVQSLMKQIFAFLKNDKGPALIRSCVFHYETEFIHPFADGNGRMGRLWQTLILMEEYPVFEFIPFETLISKTQEGYYRSLAVSDQSGKSTYFIEYMLGVIDRSLKELLDFNNRILTSIDRLHYFIQLVPGEFTRKNYMDVFKSISTATASRDLKQGVELKLLQMTGKQNKTKYRVK
jgi:Fic family protein